MYCLKAAQDKDKPWLDALRRAVYQNLFEATWGGWDEEKHLSQFKRFWEKGSIKIIEVDKFPAGMLQLTIHDDKIEIEEIQIDPAYQSRGLGAQVLGDIITQAQHEGKEAILSLGLKNTQALHLYKRLGFVEHKRTETHIHMKYKADGTKPAPLPSSPNYSQ